MFPSIRINPRGQNYEKVVDFNSPKNELSEKMQIARSEASQQEVLNFHFAYAQYLNRLKIMRRRLKADFMICGRLRIF